MNAPHEGGQRLLDEERQRHLDFQKALNGTLQSRMLALGCIDGPIEYERDVKGKGDRAQHVARHAKQIEYTHRTDHATAMTPMLGQPDGRFDDWTLVREWVWNDGGEPTVLAQEWHRGWQSRIRTEEPFKQPPCSRTP